MPINIETILLYNIFRNKTGKESSDPSKGYELIFLLKQK